MSRVLTFSLLFPSYHPRKGQQTDFVQKIWKSIGMSQSEGELYKLGIKADIYFKFPEYAPKGHTIRAGHRWKAGDKFSPRVWSAAPYNSPQIIIAPDIEIKKTWNFYMDESGIYIDGEYSNAIINKIAKNDGLSVDDFEKWFKKKKEQSFDGQIICWDSKIKY